MQLSRQAVGCSPAHRVRSTSALSPALDLADTPGPTAKPVTRRPGNQGRTAPSAGRSPLRLRAPRASVRAAGSWPRDRRELPRTTGTDAPKDPAQEPGPRPPHASRASAVRRKTSQNVSSLPESSQETHPEWPIRIASHSRVSGPTRSWPTTRPVAGCQPGSKFVGKRLTCARRRSRPSATGPEPQPSTRSHPLSTSNPSVCNASAPSTDRPVTCICRRHRRPSPANLAVLKNGRAKAVRFAALAALCVVLECQPGDLLSWEAGADGEGADGGT